MDFCLNEIQRASQILAKDFSEKHFVPIVNEYEEEEKCPTHLFEKMREAGFLGIGVPEDMGGMGLDFTSQMLIAKELSKVWSGGALSLCIVPNSLVAHPIAKYGTPKQIEKYLKPMMKGEKFGCFGLTEPDYGSHASGITTSAKRFNPFVDDFVLRGEKTFITNVTFADFILVLARTREARKGHKEHDGLTAFIVDLDEKNKKTCDIGEIKKIGMHSAPFGNIRFNETLAHVESILGEEGNGHKVFVEDTLISGRVFVAAQAWGIAEAAFEDASDYANERHTFGKPLVEHQSVGHTLADMETKMKSAEFFTLYAASLKDSESPEFRKWSSHAKIAATEAALFCADKNVLIHGGTGYTREVRAGRLLAEAKATEIYEGANLIQRNIIAHCLRRK